MTMLALQVHRRLKVEEKNFSDLAHLRSKSHK
jgi:hypothetical protein